MSKPNSIAIENPCPMSILHMKKIKGGNYCKGCKQVVVDFRKSSSEEIADTMNKKGSSLCGIFHYQQLGRQDEIGHSFSYRLKLAALTGIAFFGLNVSPLSAQTPRNNIEHDQVQISNHDCNDPKAEPGEVKKKSKRRRRRIFRRRRPLMGKRISMGCPSF